MISRILVAVDDNVFGEAIEDLVSQLKWENTPTLKIVHVIEPKDAMAAWPSEQYKVDARELIARVSSNLQKRFPEATVEEHLLEGYTADKLIDEAYRWEADLIVVGSHGRRGIRRFSLGSVSGQIVAYAPCSVVVVRQSTPHSITEEPITTEARRAT